MGELRRQRQQLAVDGVAVQEAIAQRRWDGRVNAVALVLLGQMQGGLGIRQCAQGLAGLRRAAPRMIDVATRGKPWIREAQ